MTDTITQIEEIIKQAKAKLKNGEEDNAFVLTRTAQTIAFTNLNGWELYSAIRKITITQAKVAASHRSKQACLNAIEYEMLNNALDILCMTLMQNDMYTYQKTIELLREGTSYVFNGRAIKKILKLFNKQDITKDLNIELANYYEHQFLIDIKYPINYSFESLDLYKAQMQPEKYAGTPLGDWLLYHQTNKDVIAKISKHLSEIAAKYFS